MKYNKVKLGEYLYIKGRIGWKGLKKSEYLPASKYRIINGETLTTDGMDWSKAGYISKERYMESPEIMLKKHDILISKDGTIGKIGYIEELEMPTTVASGIFVIRNERPEVVDTKFIYYFLCSPYFKAFIEMRTEGSVIPHLYQKDFVDLDFPLFSLDYQQRIAGILNSIDKKMELNKKINDNLEQQAKSIFNQWFMPYISGHTTIPDGWRVTTIAELDVVVTDYVANGSFKSLSDNVQYLSEETNNVLIRLTDYNNGFNADMIYLSDASYNFLSKSKLFGDEVIISNVGANVGTIFRCPRLKKNMSLAPNAIMLSSKKFEHYLYLYFSSSYGQQLLQSIVTGSAQPKFNKTNFRSLRVMIPSPNVMDHFNEVYGSIYEQVVNNQMENSQLTKIRDTLLPKLMTGEIDVSNINL